MGLAGVSGHEWTKGRISRLYVRRGDARIGWVNLQTGERTLELPRAFDDFEEFTRKWVVKRNLEAAAEGKTPLRLRAVALAAPKQPAYDLAANKAGAGVEEKAKELAGTISASRRYANSLIGKRSEDEAWELGAAGEEQVAAELAQLSDAWRVLHSVPIGSQGSDIDHVVIGPPGVITINTKNHSRSRVLVHGNYVSISGKELPYARNSRFESDRAATALTRACKFEVRSLGVVAIIAPVEKFVIKEQPKDGKVRVMRHVNLRAFLATRPTIYTPRHVEAIYAKARISTTWT